MKISCSLLRELVRWPANLSEPEVARRLGLAGVAVDGIQTFGAGVSGIVVAEIRGKRPHPKADKLTLVDVFDGKEVTQVVCGAPNVPAPGEPGKSPRVAWARPGATLPGGITLAVRDVRGVPSPGMLCAEDELGLSTDHAGIILLSPEDGLEIGSDFLTGAGLPDTVFELDITPNRPDLLGHVGLAREFAALFGTELTLRTPDLSRFADPRPASELAAVEIRDPEGCPRYLAHVLTGLRVAPSPLRLRLLLQRLGVRPRSNLVDATNLALLEWGHPLHAFDLRTLGKRTIVVRRAHVGETLKTLDGTERTLAPEDLIIADAERATALAGVLGGSDSEITSTTTDVLLESAYFQPASVRRTARRHKLHTEASHRFERGTDPNDGLDQAAQRCAELLLTLGGGRIAQGRIDVYPRPIEKAVVPLRPGRTDQMLGLHVPAAVQKAKLTALGLTVAAGGGETLAVTVPTARPDLTREIDLIEEVGRLVGYEEITPKLPVLRMAPPREPSVGETTRKNAERARDLCAALGLDEVILFSMTGPERLRTVGGAHAERRPPLLLDNPLREELSALRTQLLPGLLEALRGNLAHGLPSVRLFEVGEVFWPGAGGQPEERPRAVGVLAGPRPHFLKPTHADETDVHDVRGLVDSLLTGLGYELTFGPPAEGAAKDPRAVFIRAAAPDETPWLHPGVAAVVVSAATGEIIGDFGEVHPDLRRKLDLERRAFSFEIDVPTLPRAARGFVPPARFPAVTRDLSFFVDAGVPVADVLASLHGAGEALLTDVHVLEDYREAGKVPAGQKGLLLNLTYRDPQRTLTDDEVQKAHERALGRLKGRLQITLRQ